MARPAAVITYTTQDTLMSSGSCARKIRMAKALTKPVTTERDTKRISPPQLQHPGQYLEDTGQQRCSKQILKPVIFDQTDHDECHGARCRRDHARSPSGKRNDDRNTERGIQADFRIDACDD